MCEIINSRIIFPLPKIIRSDKISKTTLILTILKKKVPMLKWAEN